MTLLRRVRDVWIRHWMQRRWVRVAVAVVVSMLGGFVAFVSAAFGHCAAFGGLCPDPPQPWWQDDVLGGVMVGIALVVFSIGIAIRTDRRGVLLSAAAAAAISIPVAIVAARAAHTGGW